MCRGSGDSSTAERQLSVRERDHGCSSIAAALFFPCHISFFHTSSGSGAARAGFMSIPPGNLPSGTGRPLGQPSPGLGTFGAGRGGAGGPSAGSMGANFPFGAAGSSAFSQSQSLQQQSQGNLDLSDFPALGAGNSHQGQAEWGQGEFLQLSDAWTRAHCLVTLHWLRY